MSIEHTARTGADKGYYMIVPEDGCSTMNADWHNASINYALQNVVDRDDVRRRSRGAGGVSRQRRRSRRGWDRDEGAARRSLPFTSPAAAQPSRAQTSPPAREDAGRGLPRGRRPARGPRDRARRARPGRRRSCAWPRSGSAAPTCTRSAASGRGRRRWCSATRARASSRRSGRASSRAAPGRPGRALLGARVRRVRRLPPRPAGRVRPPAARDRRRDARRRHDRASSWTARRSTAARRPARSPSASSSRERRRCRSGDVPLEEAALLGCAALTGVGAVLFAAGSSRAASCS